MPFQNNAANLKVLIFRQQLQHFISPCMMVTEVFILINQIYIVFMPFLSNKKWIVMRFWCISFEFSYKTLYIELYLNSREYTVWKSKVPELCAVLASIHCNSVSVTMVHTSIIYTHLQCQHLHVYHQTSVQTCTLGNVHNIYIVIYLLHIVHKHNMCILAWGAGWRSSYFREANLILFKSKHIIHNHRTETMSLT